MKEIFKKELMANLLTDKFQNMELIDKSKKIKFHLIKFDNTYKIEISKQIDLNEEEFLYLQTEINKIYKEIENTKEQWENPNIDYPNLKKLWEFYYQDNEIDYKKEGSVTYPESWISFFQYIANKYI